MTLADLTPVDWFIAQQRELTPVERFSAAHSAGTVVAPERRYEDRIPAARPQPGQQYAFSVDLDACTGCKACVAACRSLNGLDDDESWRSVGLLRGVAPGTRYQQTVTTGCHHCLDPACLSGCPAEAYEKDPATGVVIHLDDACIGCRYCTLTCPYEVPRFNRSRGIVRKCDLCHERLAEGEAPACVQGCPNGAITITVVDTVELRAKTTTSSALVPGAPSSSITVPTTVYRTARGETTDVLAADSDIVHPAQAHPPLAVMLVLTQLAVGALVAGLALGVDEGWFVLAAGLVALGASTLHLGRPLLAWRAVLGLRHSWLSREALAFAVFAGLASLDAVFPTTPIAVAAALAGVFGVACSAMIYVRTHRVWWRARRVLPLFACTTAVTGLGAIAVARPEPGLLAAISVLVVAGLAVQALDVFGPHRDGDRANTARLLRHDLRTWTRARFAFGIGGALLFALLAVFAAPLASPVVAAVALLLLVAGELVERSLFFLAVTAPRMPGERP